MEEIFAPPVMEGQTAAEISALPRKPGLGRSVISGLAWLLAQNLGSRLMMFASQLILARLLVPSDFAALALAGTITALVGVFANFGVDDVLLQRMKTFRYWSGTAFWTSLGLSTIGMAVVSASAPLAARMYHAPVLVPVLLILGLGMPLTALSTVPGVMMRAALNFRFLAIYNSLELLVTQSLIIVLAARGHGVFSFVVPLPVMALVRAAVFWVFARPRIGQLRLWQFKVMVAKGAAVAGSRIITAAVGQGDYFVLGLLAPKPVVGAYYFAFKLSAQPLQALAGSLQNVLFPALAQLANETSRQQKAALDAARSLALVVMPFCFLQAAVARPLLTLAFGPKWALAIPLAQILSIGLAFDAVSWIAGSLLSARGEFKRAFIYSCIFSPGFFIFVAAGAVADSAIGVAMAVSLFYMIFPYIYSHLVFSSIGISAKQTAMVFISPASLAAFAMGFAYEISHVLAKGDVTNVLMTACIGIPTYTLLMRVFEPALWATAQSKIMLALHK